MVVKTRFIAFIGILLVITAGFVAGYLFAEDPEVYPRIFTPNEDSKNDVVNFNFADPDPGGNTLYPCSIYDILGHEIVVLDTVVAGGTISATWDGKDDSNNVVPSGVYIYQIEASTKVFNGTIVLAK